MSCILYTTHKMRIKLSEKYKVEREEVCKKLIDIIELDSNNSFLLCELDNDIEKKTKIRNRRENIIFII